MVCTHASISSKIIIIFQVSPSIKAQPQTDCVGGVCGGSSGSFRPNNPTSIYPAQNSYFHMFNCGTITRIAKGLGKKLNAPSVPTIHFPYIYDVRSSDPILLSSEYATSSPPNMAQDTILCLMSLSLSYDLSLMSSCYQVLQSDQSSILEGFTYLIREGFKKKTPIKRSG